MHNPNSGLLQAPTPRPAAGRYVRVKPGVRGFVQGSRYVTPEDPPFPVDDRRAAELVKAGLAVPCAPTAAPIEDALAPAAAAAERSTGRRQRS